MSSTELSLTCRPAGEQALIFYLPSPVTADYPQILRALAALLMPLGIIDHVIAYGSVLLIYEKTCSASALIKAAHDYLPEAIVAAERQSDSQTITIPVCYDETFAPDLSTLAKAKGLSVAAVIAKHCQHSYRVYCVGFIPGFAFLGFVDEAIAMPRRAKPRKAVPAGSLGIAGRQTAIYPCESPGGWQIIGRTPMPLYAPQQGIYSRLQVGDNVKFEAISAQVFADYSDEIGHG